MCYGKKLMPADGGPISINAKRRGEKCSHANADPCDLYTGKHITSHLKGTYIGQIVDKRESREGRANYLGSLKIEVRGRLNTVGTWDVQNK